MHQEQESSKKSKGIRQEKQIRTESTKLPGKLADCSSNEPELCEIYIVEEILQAVLQRMEETEFIRQFFRFGEKMLNVEKARLDKVYGNEKLIPVVTALGTGIGEDF